MNSNLIHDRNLLILYKILKSDLHAIDVEIFHCIVGTEKITNSIDILQQKKGVCHCRTVYDWKTSPNGQINRIDFLQKHIKLKSLEFVTHERPIHHVLIFFSVLYLQ